jgi:hypothetical protein
MRVRDAIIAVVALVIGLTTGISVCPQNKLVNTPLVSFDLCAHTIRISKDNKQTLATMYCSEITSGITQCIIFDSPKKNARLIGIEYIIDKLMYDKLNDKDKVAWQPLKFEIEAGLMVFPGLDSFADKNQATKFKTAYSKTIYGWSTNNMTFVSYASIPSGEATMCTPIQNLIQIDSVLMHQRDTIMGVNTEKIKNQRNAKYTNVNY